MSPGPSKPTNPNLAGRRTRACHNAPDGNLGVWRKAIEMNPPTTIPTLPAEPSFETCELIGGPHDGQTVKIPDSQNQIQLYSDDRPHRYHRLNRSARLHHETRIGLPLGGGR